MKIRQGFVSNSSSSSFVVAGDGPHLNMIKVDEFVIGKEGETEFGWGPETIRDMASRINFAYLQTVYSGKNDCKEMLFNLIKEKTGATEVVSIISDDYSGKGTVWGYIDHQSAAPDNTEIFDSKEKLADFLFAEDSKIVLDNDNH